MKWLPGHLLVVVAVLVCVRLGWWQWDRTRESDGTVQNLAYAVLWPAFGASFIYMWWRFLALETSREAEDDRTLDEDLAALSEQEGAAEASGGSADLNPFDPADPAVATQTAEQDEPDVREPTAAADRYDYFIGTVEDVDEDEDPELAAYNRALAALAEEDRRRAG